MKKVTILLGVVVAIALASCIKEDTFDHEAQYELEKPIIAAYAQEHLTNPQLHEPTGVWYEIESTGDPESYQYKLEYPNVWVNYTGKLVSTNATFDSNDSDAGAGISLGQVIGAWQIALFPKEIEYDADGNLLSQPEEFGGITQQGIKKGGIIRIVTPSRWGYGNRSQGSIPANSPLYFEIKIIDIKSPQPAQ